MHAAGNLTPVNAVVNNEVQLSSGGNIISAFSNLTSGQTLRLGPGIWTLDGNRPVLPTSNFTNAPLKLINRTNLTIFGTGNSIIHVTNNGGALVYMGCSNLTFKGIIFRGTLTNGTTYDTTALNKWGLVVSYWTNDNVTFEDCRWETANAFGLISGEGAAGEEQVTRNLRVRGGSFFKCGFTNWAGAAANPDGGAAQIHGDADFDGVLFERCGRGVEPFCNSGFTSEYNFTVRNCTFKDIWSRCIFNVSSGVSVVGMVVDKCFFSFDPAARHDASEVIQLENTRGARISQCTFTNVPNTCPVLWSIPTAGNLNDLYFENNFVSHAFRGLVIRAQRGASVSGNTFEWCTNSAVQAMGSEIEVSRNLFRNCSTSGSATEPVVSGGLAGIAMTNLTVRHNTFLRTAGSAPHAFIGLGAACVRPLILGNVYQDYVGNTTTVTNEGATDVRSDAQARNNNGTNILFSSVYFAFDWPIIPAGSNTVTVVTVAGVTNTDYVHFAEDLNTYTNAFSVTNAVFKSIASNGTVHVYCRNHGSFSIDPGNGTNRLLIMRATP